MDPRQFLLALRARWVAAIVVATLTIAGVMAVSERLPKRYTAETAVMVDVRSPDPVAAVLLPSTMVPGTMNTQVEIIKSDLVGRKVVKILKFDENRALKELWLDSTNGKVQLEAWIATLVQRGLNVTPSRDSNVVTLSYTGSNPDDVAAIANAFAQAYIEVSIELKVDPAKQYSKWFGEQATVLRDRVEKAQARLSEFQRSKGIVATDEALDFEVTRLNDLSARLTAAQAETRDAQSKQRSGAAADTLPEVQQNSLVSGLRANISQLEVKLKEAATNFGPRHPQYLRMELELAELKKRLAVETSHVATTYAATSTVGKTREAELRNAIEAQKKKLLSLRRERDEIAVLVRDVETEKRAYEAVTNRLNQTHLESQANRTNVSVLSPALVPLEPTFPKAPGKMLLMAIGLGIFLGGGCVFLLELLDRRIRTTADLADMLQLPVLGLIERRGGGRRLASPARLPALPAAK